MTEEKQRTMLPGVNFLLGTGKYARDKKYASFNRRMIAATVDSLIAMVVLAPLIDWYLSTYSPLPPVDWAAVGERIPQGASDEESNRIIARYLVESGHVARWFNNFMVQCMALSMAAGICWHFWAATPGKMLLRLKVVDAKTETHPTDTQIIMRLMGYVVSAIPLGLGFFWMGLDKRKQGWHDKLANTVVIVVSRQTKQEATPASEAVVESDSQEPSTKE
ncbi:MAG: RDD family protein [Rickettsiales bacterium]